MVEDVKKTISNYDLKINAMKLSKCSDTTFNLIDMAKLKRRGQVVTQTVRNEFEFQAISKQVFSDLFVPLRSYKKE